jgi:uncharacterized membrane-anchored protein
MKRPWFLMGCFAVLALAQLAVPVMMIARHERTLQTGELYKFRTMPVDPYDPFRGRYVQLRLEQNSVPVPTGEVWRNGQTAFALIDTGADGFSKLGELRATRPDELPYLTVKVSQVVGQPAYLRVPLDRYYMEESLAPAAEKAYWEHSRAGNRTAYITVRIQDGFGVIENLWINGVPIREFVARK